ncbi:HAD family hydrolase [Algoriphagus zhangzhouensis]|uniref:phosphoglycolate phosphatase n=1 Tax=Algoriphagus zhangzhouensis TaxID=1073327 RepID=A0A1M7ZKG2_9BACT|nr:HAD hydrolase-like protein [Algoriphagus zhangzhouensis]TDY42870.1 phosphoglycolate phosphatase-like HAD superfamily hydrolase [Algoriphagus zhangzhouensis]SHO65383.1 Phosphoglycolate phosphatase, HAD superfamily [Algoriphagus zhangzhouensis]
MKDLEKYEVILWDFDGVILDSMPTRELGFRKVLEEYPKEQVEELIQFHYKNGGWSRYVKFRYFFEEILGKEVTTDFISELCSKFSRIMLDLLSSKELLILDSLGYIQGNFSNQEMHIVSGSDQKELRLLCQQLDIHTYFSSINGSPTPKIELVKNLLQIIPFSRSEIVLIGDSRNDLEAAEINGIDFFGYNNWDLQKDNGYILSFS